MTDWSAVADLSIPLIRPFIAFGLIAAGAWAIDRRLDGRWLTVDEDRLRRALATARDRATTCCYAERLAPRVAVLVAHIREVRSDG